MYYRYSNTNMSYPKKSDVKSQTRTVTPFTPKKPIMNSWAKIAATPVPVKEEIVEPVKQSEMTVITKEEIEEKIYQARVKARNARCGMNNTNFSHDSDEEYN